MLKRLIDQAETDCTEQHASVSKRVEKNQKRVLDAFKTNRVSDHHFQSTTGYGYDDLGRETLEAVYADVFGGEDALVRPQMASGTHAIATALFGLLRPGNELLYITGKPYDTLESVIGISGQHSGSLYDFCVTYKQVDLLNDGSVDFASINDKLSENTKVIGIQRSKGYDDRPSFTIDDIEEMVQYVKAIKQDVIVFVDNCYGEFVEEREPLHVGADVIAGSLIKNPGGGLARSGGYIAGKTTYVAQCANRLSAPGLGKETGPTFNMLHEMFQGLFLAPHVVGEALKGAILTARFLALAGFQTSPHYKAERTDLIQTVTLHNKEKMIAFCQVIQQNSPIDAFVTPFPSDMPGYEDDVIMAAGTFIQGASLELTADGPIREPYMAFIQGGLTYSHVKLALEAAVNDLVEQNLLVMET